MPIKLMCYWKLEYQNDSVSLQHGALSFWSLLTLLGEVMYFWFTYQNPENPAYKSIEKETLQMIFPVNSAEMRMISFIIISNSKIYRA